MFIESRQKIVIFILICLLAGVFVSFLFIKAFDFSLVRKSELIGSEFTSSSIGIRISDVSGDDPTIVNLVEKVSKHILMPNGKVTVTTIINADALVESGSEFYKLVKNGDKVLFYSNKAILYRPDIDRVINMANGDFAINN